MPIYRYEAMTSSGEEVVDVFEADDSKAARKLLAARGLFVTKLSKPAANSSDVSESEPFGLTRPIFFITKNPFAHGLMCFLGLAFLTFGYGGWSWASYWREHGKRTVVEVVKTQANEVEGVYRYKAAGRTIKKPRFVKGVQRSRGGWSSYAFGMRLDALYDPDEPKRVVLEREVANFELASPIFLGFGSVFLLGGMAGFAVIIRQTNKTGNS